MLIGAMNHPAHDVLAELAWMAEMKLDFVDLTLEPPAAATWLVRTSEIRRALADYGMPVVGHTAFYLPLGSAFESLRRTSVNELMSAVECFAEVGAQWMNIHPDRHTPMHDRAFFIRRNVESLTAVIAHGKKCGIGIMIENLPGEYNNAAQLGELLDPLPELGLHLDIGHCNLLVPHNTTGEIMARYGNRLKHVHLHDNKGGGADLHLPLGAGTLDLRRELEHLCAHRYDATVTLEVFTPDRHYLAYSRDVLRRVWAEVLASAREREPAMSRA